MRTVLICALFLAIVGFSYAQECEVWIYKSQPSDDELFVKTADNAVFTEPWNQESPALTRFGRGAPFAFGYFAVRNCPEVDCELRVWNGCGGKQATEDDTTFDRVIQFFQEESTETRGKARSFYYICGQPSRL